LKWGALQSMHLRLQYGSFYQEQTFTVAKLSGRVWSEKVIEARVS
jgi:hypothetical protein